MRIPSNDSFVGRVARLPLRLVPSEKPVAILSGPLRGKRWIPGAGTHGCWLGWFELDEQRHFVSLLSPGMVVYDVGAFVGFYSLLSATLTGAGGRVIAFEPLPRNLRYLREHLRLNDVASARVVAAAVSDRAGSARLFVSESPSQSSLQEGANGIDVPVVTIDEVASTERPPNLLKIDVEGAEGEVLAGARRTLAEARPHVLLSTHNAGAREHSLDILRSLGYACTPMKAHDAPHLAMEWYAAPLPA